MHYTLADLADSVSFLSQIILFPSRLLTKMDSFFLSFNDAHKLHSFHLNGDNISMTT